jgi:hypothetical protein
MLGEKLRKMAIACRNTLTRACFAPWALKLVVALVGDHEKTDLHRGEPMRIRRWMT